MLDRTSHLRYHESLYTYTLLVPHLRAGRDVGQAGFEAVSKAVCESDILGGRVNCGFMASSDDTKDAGHMLVPKGHHQSRLL